MSLTPIFHPEEDWLKSMVDKDQGSLVPQNRKEEWYSEIINSMQSGGGSGGGSGVEFVKFSVEFNGGAMSPVVDHTIEEIDAARTAGKLIIGLFGDPQQMTVVSYSGEDDYPYSAVFYVFDIEGDSLTVSKDGFSYEEGEWVYSNASVFLSGNA